MSNLNRTAKLAYFTARKRDGDVKKISEEVGSRTDYVRRMLNGERKINYDVADYAYHMTRNRKRNSEIGYYAEY